MKKLNWLAMMWLLPLWAGAADEGITVDGRGRSEAMPDTVELQGTLSGEAELGADAVVKYRDTKRRVEEALKQLEIEQLKIEWTGIKVGPGVADTQAAQQAAMRGQVAPADVNQVAVADSATLILSGLGEMEEGKLLDTLVRLIDASKDSGLTVPPAGQPILATFKLKDMAAAEKEAYAMAMKDARARAERLAELAEVRLGPIRSVEVTSTPASSPGGHTSVVYPYNPYVRPPTVSGGRGELVSMERRLIPVEVTLRVRFTIAGS